MEPPLKIRRIRTPPVGSFGVSPIGSKPDFGDSEPGTGVEEPELALSTIREQLALELHPIETSPMKIYTSELAFGEVIGDASADAEGVAILLGPKNPHEYNIRVGCIGRDLRDVTVPVPPMARGRGSRTPDDSLVP